MNRRQLIAAFGAAVASIGLVGKKASAAQPGLTWTLLHQTEPQRLWPRGAEYLGAGAVDGEPVIFIQIVDSPVYPTGVIQTWRVT